MHRPFSLLCSLLISTSLLHFSLSLRLCIVSSEARAKCEAFSKAASFLQNETDLSFGSDYSLIECFQMSSKSECMTAIDSNEIDGPNAMMVEAGDAFEAGRYHSLVPILNEIYEDKRDFTQALALIRVDSDLHKKALNEVLRTKDLRNAKVCFSEVGSLAGWHLPLYRLMRLRDGIRVIDCNNHVKSAMNFFGKGCAINVLRNRFNPLGDNSQQFCEQCGSLSPGIRCTSRDPFAGFQGALRCINNSDIAFVNDLVLKDYNFDINIKLLCPKETTNDYYYDTNEGDNNEFDEDLEFSLEPLSKIDECSWGSVPSQVLVVSSAMPMQERSAMQNMLMKAAILFGKANFNQNNNNYYTPASVLDEAIKAGDNNDNNYGNNNDGYGRTRNDYDDLGPEQSNQQGFSNDYDINDYAVDTSNNNNDNNFGSNSFGSTNNYNDPGFANNNFGNNEFNTGINPDQVLSGISNATESLKKTTFRLFDSFLYGDNPDLIFSDRTQSFQSLTPEMMSYKAFLGKLLQTDSRMSSVSSLQMIEGVKDCGASRMALCITSDAELVKCARMRTALKAQLLRPQMQCVRRNDPIECMAAISRGDADITMLDAGDVYRAGHTFGLIPIMAEIYNLDGPFAYAVAVAKQRDNSSELIYLKKRNTCHTGVGHGAGWIVPMAWLITNERVRDYGCDSLGAAAQYFSKACAPGANDQVLLDFVNTQRNLWETDHLCDLCHGSAEHYCERNHHEDYYGHSGAFRCLVEGGGHVAFVKHTTVTENCDGKRKEWWARNQLTTDYELLCRDGTRAPATDYKNCYLGTVKSNAAVTNPKFGQRRIDAFINLLQYAQQFYGQKTADEFSFAMFYSEEPHADLIFQDATQQLVVLDEEERHHTRYLDSDFLQAYEKVMCNSNASRNNLPLLAFAIPLLGALLLSSGQP